MQMSRYKHKYRTDSIRLPYWDYSREAAYFITICTKHRKKYFGRITDGQMVLSRAGVIADLCWNAITNHAPNTQLGVYTIMPDHLHGIVIISHTSNKAGGSISRSPNSEANPLERLRNPGKGTLSSIVGSYKSAVTKHANRLGFPFAWQPRFYDHIIRSETSYQLISKYIYVNAETRHALSLQSGKHISLVNPPDPIP